MADQRTIDIYDAQASAYRDLQDSYPPLTYFDSFVETVPGGGYVLDLGCGPGQFAARMIANGLYVDALDASEAMAELAQQDHGIEVRVGTFDDVTEQDVYDGVWAHFSLLHAPRAEMPRHLAAIRRALKPGGAFLIALKLGDGEERDRLDRFYTYYGEAELLSLLDDAGFTAGHRSYGCDKGLGGQDDEWIAVLCTAD